MAIDKLKDRFQSLLDEGYSPTKAMLVVVDSALEEDRKDFLHQRDYRYTRTAIRSHADDLLERLLQEDPDLTIMRSSSEPTAAYHLGWMLVTVQREVFRWPLDKLGRWVGYVQGVLVEQKKLNVEEERARTRTVYQVAYAADGLKIPETL